VPAGSQSGGCIQTPDSTAFHILESIRLDLGFGSQVHP